jgi:pantoate--beta-alanine ligase
MQRPSDPEAFRAACAEARSAGARVGLVPTMGALHAGHVALIAEARRRADFVAVTVFVNPTQFGPAEDFARYPRTLEADAAKCLAAGASCLFAPVADAMYPPGEEARVRVGATAAELCGRARPGHFEGVATVVAKLFNLAGPSVAVFGRKDYQQLKVIQRFAKDLMFPVEVVGAPTVREADGLALSSRNAYLSEPHRRAARAIPEGLSSAVRAFDAGERSAARLTALAQEVIAAAADSIDYVALADADTLVPLAAEDRANHRAVLAVAARFGGTRLIDNVVLGEDGAPLSAERSAR